jgi:hypothetical protein
MEMQEICGTNYDTYACLPYVSADDHLRKKCDVQDKGKEMRRVKMESRIQILSTVRVQNSPDLYKVVDSLNRTLKKQDLMFGLALDEKDKDKAIFTIYRT